MHRGGSLHLITGPMFAGKTSLLQRHIQQSRRKGKQAVLISFKGGNRMVRTTDSDDAERECLISSHDGLSLKSIECAADTLMETLLLEDVKNASVIGIDEGQFFMNLTPFCNQCVAQGRTVYVSALNCDFEQEDFVAVNNIRRWCHTITVLQAVCEVCRADALFSKKIANLDNGKGIDIGGLEKYIPVCGTCYHKDTKEVVQHMKHHGPLQSQVESIRQVAKE